MNLRVDLVTTTWTEKELFQPTLVQGHRQVPLIALAPFMAALWVKIRFLHDIWPVLVTCHKSRWRYPCVPGTFPFLSNFASLFPIRDLSSIESSLLQQAALGSLPPSFPRRPAASLWTTTATMHSFITFSSKPRAILGSDPTKTYQQVSV